MRKKIFFKKSWRAEFTAGILIFFLVFGSLSTLVLPVSASPLALIPAGSITLDTNSCAVVGVYADNIPSPGLAGYNLDINYDPSQIQIMSITRSASFSPPTPEFGVNDLNPSPVPGKVTVVYASSSGTQGNIKLFNIKVKAVRTITDASPFTISVTDFCGPDLVNLTPALQLMQIPDEPNVSADDQTNQIIGLVAGMEYSIDNSAFTLFDSANLPNLSGNHTVFVRMASTATSPPGAEKMLTFTSLERVSIPQAVVGATTYDSGNVDYIAYGDVIHLTSPTPDVIFYYTLGVSGSEPENPSSEGTAYVDSTGIPILDGKTIIKAIAVKDGMADSSIAAFTFINKVSTPYVIVSGTQYHSQGGVPASFSVPQGVPVYLASSTDDVFLYYTMDGSSPTTGSDLYNTLTGITNLPSGTTTLKVLGTKNSLANSGIPTFFVTVSQPTASIAPTAAQISVLNNPTGTNDTVTVQDLHGGDTVNVYADATTQTALGTGTLPTTQNTGSEMVIIPQLGTTAGTVYVSVTSPGMSESSRTAVGYSAEVMGNPLNVAIDNVNGRAGQNVTLNINLTDVAVNSDLGIVASSLTVNYDIENLQLVSTASGAIVPVDAVLTANPTNAEITAGANPGQIVFVESDETQGTNLITTDGTFATMVFKVKDTTASGVYPITFSSISSDNSFTKMVDAVTPDDILGFVLTPGSITVTSPTQPPAPNVTRDDTANTVTGMTIGMEYKLDDAAAYVAYNEVTFANLNLAGNHTLLVRVAAEGINPAGPDTALTFTTDPVTPPAPNVTRDDTANTVNGMATGMEYNLDGAGYVDYVKATFDSINFAGAHTLLVRVAAEGINLPSTDVSLIFTADTPLIVSIANATGLIGKNVEVTINLQNVQQTLNGADGIVNSNLKILYDNRYLEVNSITPGPYFENALDFTVNTQVPGEIVFLSQDDSFGERLINLDGVYATINFSIKPDTPIGDYQITFADTPKLFSTLKISSFELSRVVPTTVGSIITVKSLLVGDVNGDNLFDVTDLGYLKLYLLGKITSFPSPYGMNAGNVDGQGTVPDVTDYGYMKLRLLGKIAKFPIE